jgi:hypothetical protein
VEARFAIERARGQKQVESDLECSVRKERCPVIPVQVPVLEMDQGGVICDDL